MRTSRLWTGRVASSSSSQRGGFARQTETSCYHHHKHKNYLTHWNVSLFHLSPVFFLFCFSFLPSGRISLCCAHQSMLCVCLVSCARLILSLHLTLHVNDTPGENRWCKIDGRCQSKLSECNEIVRSQHSSRAPEVMRCERDDRENRKKSKAKRFTLTLGPISSERAGPLVVCGASPLTQYLI